MVKYIQKGHIRKYRLVCLCVIYLFLFSGCADRADVKKEQTDNITAMEHVINTAESIVLQEDSDFTVWNTDWTEERKLIHKTDKDQEDWFESIRIGNNRCIYSATVYPREIFYSIDNSGLGEREELFSVDEAECHILDYTIDAKGNAYFLILESAEDKEEIWVWKYDLDGVRTDIRQLNDFHKGEEDECYNWQIRAQSNGSVLVYSRLGYILLDEKGSTLQEEAFEQPQFYEVWYIGDDIAVIEKYDNVTGGVTYWERHPETGQEKQIQNMPSGTCLTFLGDGQGNIVFCTDAGLYSYASKTSEMQTLFRWTDYGILGEEVAGIYCKGQELHCILLPENAVYDVTFKEDKREKAKLLLGCIGEDPWVREGVAEFNRAHSDCVILIEDYLQEDEKEAAQVLYREVLAGNGPDIIAFDPADVNDLILGKSSMLEDLNTYLEKSTVIGKGDIVEPLYDALQADNKLYMLPTNFCVDMLITKKKWLDQNGGWDCEKMLTVLKENSGLDIYVSRSEMLESYALYGITGQKGYEIDRESIKKYLQIAEMLPDWYYFPTDDLIKREGKALFQGINVYNVQDYLCDISFWGEDSAITGYPQIQGNGMAFYPVNCFSISAKSKQKEMAWKFIESFFAGEGQTNCAPDWMYFSVCKDVLDKQLSQALKRDYYINENGEREEIPIQTYYLGEELESVYAAREEDIARIKDIIGETKVVRRQNDSVVDILLEEASVYFSGDKGLEEVTGIIENRLKLLQEEE